MALDSRYITSVSLEEYLVDKNTGLPLANGSVEFWQDDDRVVPKLVYQLSGAPPNYTYTPLPNPITLSAVGTIQNSGGDNIALYYFPFDSDQPDANVQLYYIVVKDSSGAVQFTREAWPNLGEGGGDSASASNDFSNELSNPQFVDVLFNPSETFNIAYTGATTTEVQIAPDWVISIQHTGAGNISVVRTSIVGSTALPTNPPYTLSITGGTNISRLRLRQRLPHNPDIWAPSVAGVRGYIAGSALLGDGTQATMYYTPSVGTEQQIFTANNNTGAPKEFGDTIQLLPASNTASSDVGYVDISIQIPTTGTSVISSIQVVGLNSDQQGVSYQQTPVNRQEDYLFHYYNPLLQYKPIPSHLVGWDFPLNPAQFLGDIVAPQATGNNSSYYAWDQTIWFQSVTSGITTSRNTSGGIVATVAAGTQIAMIQYLSQVEARKILNQPISVNVASYATENLNAVVSLYYTTDVNLPDLNANASIVATLGLTGKPATFNGTWTEVPRVVGNANFTIAANAVDGQYFDYQLSGWDATVGGTTGLPGRTATYFAIVISTAPFAGNGSVDFLSVGLCSGKIATRPAPQTINAVADDCRVYYQKSFLKGVVPGAGLGVNTGELVFSQPTGPGIPNMTSQTIPFPIEMRATPDIITYNPAVAASVQIYNETIGTSWSATTDFNTSAVGFAVRGTTPGGSAAEQIAGVHWTADARLGIV